MKNRMTSVKNWARPRVAEPNRNSFLHLERIVLCCLSARSTARGNFIDAASYTAITDRAGRKYARSGIHDIAPHVTVFTSASLERAINMPRMPCTQSLRKSLNIRGKPGNRCWAHSTKCQRLRISSLYLSVL
jgi:hypothetical protein